jgi:cytokinin dehydrogenase
VKDCLDLAADPNLLFEAQLSRVGIEASRTASELASASSDFGRIVQSRPQGVIRVRDEHELQRVVEAANAFGARLTARSGGNSQSGQSVAHRSYCLSVSDLERFVRVDPGASTVTCSANSSWRAVAEAAARHQLIPKVVPLNLDLSVGGTLSAGGVGASSHRYGSAASNVVSLTAVTGAGQRVTCSHSSRPEVFDAVLAGLGRTAVLTSATLSLRPMKRHVQTVFALYTNLRDCLTDMRMLGAQAACSYLEGSCSTSFQGLKKTSGGRQPLLRWFYGLQFSLEYETEPAPDFQWLADQLHCLEIVHHETDDHLLFLDRYQARFESMRRSGAWQQTHPWLECLLPAERASAFIDELLPMVPHVFGDGHRLFSVQGTSNPKYLQLPVGPTDTSLVVALLPGGIPESSLPVALEFVRRATDLLHRHGGKRYLSGWLAGGGDDFWRRHHGSLYEEWVLSKQALDPNDILTSELFSA